MKGSDFIFYCVNFTHYKCHQLNLKYGGAHVGSPELIQNNIAHRNPINDDDECFQYSATVALNHEDVEKNLQRMSNI